MEIQERDWVRVGKDYLTTEGNRFKNDGWVLKGEAVEVVLISDEEACIREGFLIDKILRAPLRLSQLDLAWRPKFKVGDRVKLALTPEISAKKNSGWGGSKHFLVKGHPGTVVHVSGPGIGKEVGGYFVDFDDQTYLHFQTGEKIPCRHGLYGVHETWIVAEEEMKEDEDKAEAETEEEPVQVKGLEGEEAGRSPASLR